MHPVGTNRAACFPKISAARFSNRFTVGSSPYTSSPTSASAIARRISTVGRVTVSLRKSTIPSSRVTLSASLRIPLFAIVPLTMSILPVSSPCTRCPLHARCRILPSNSPRPGPPRRSPHQFHKHLIRDAYFPGSQPEHIPFSFDKSSRFQRPNSRPQRNSVFPLNPRNVNPVQLPQSQKQFLFQCTIPGYLLQLLNRNATRLHRAH